MSWRRPHSCQLAAERERKPAQPTSILDPSCAGTPMAKCALPSASMHTELPPPITKTRGARATGKTAGIGRDPKLPIAAAVDLSITLTPLRLSPRARLAVSRSWIGRGSRAASPHWLSTMEMRPGSRPLPRSHFRPQPANAAAPTIAGGVMAARRRRKIALTNGRHPPLSPPNRWSFDQQGMR
jgi:hypothetical protein